MASHRPVNPVSRATDAAGTLSGSPQQEVATTVKKLLSHAAGAVLEGALVAILITGLLVGTAFAAKSHTSGGSTSATLAGPVMVSDANGDNHPNVGDSITFNVSTSAAKPEVGVRCWQGTDFVEDAYIAFFDTWLGSKYVTLGSSYWNASLTATCTARLFYYDSRAREHVLATMSFGVAT